MQRTRREPARPPRTQLHALIPTPLDDALREYLAACDPPVAKTAAVAAALRAFLRAKGYPVKEGGAR